MNKERQNKRQVHNDYYKRGCQMIVAMALVMILILVLVTYAWYTLLQKRQVNSEERDVMQPYYLYLVDKNGTDVLDLTVGNLHPGETKQIVIGVTNQKPEGAVGSDYTIAKDSQFNYELELAHTNNLPLNYTVYALKKNASASGENIYTVTWTDENKNTVTMTFEKTKLNNSTTSETITNINNTEMYSENVSNTVNLGTYVIYDNTSGSDFQLNSKVENGSVTFDLNYYLIELSWQEGIQFSDYLKETDLMYVIVNAMQLEPQENETTTTSAESQ